MRTQRPAASASGQCRRCTAVVLRGSSRCTLCGWPVGAAYPPVDGEPPADLVATPEAEPVDAEVDDQEAADSQLDALAQLAGRRTPATGSDPAGAEASEASEAQPALAETLEAVPADQVRAEALVAVNATSAGPAPAPAPAPAASPAPAPTGPSEGLPEDRPVPTAHDAAEAAAVVPADVSDPVHPDVPAADLLPDPGWAPPPDTAWGQAAVRPQGRAHHAAAAGAGSGVLPPASGPVGAAGRRAASAILAVPAIHGLSLLLLAATVMLFDQGVSTLVAGGDASSTLGTSGLLLLATSLLSLVLLATVVVGIVFFLLWVSRARAEVVALSAVRQRWSPTWSVAGWLIPLFNVYLGWQVLDDLWRGSDPAHRAGEGHPTTPTPARPVNAWLASTVGVLVAFVVDSALFHGSLVGKLLPLAAVAASAWFLCRTITQVSRWQDGARRG